MHSVNDIVCKALRSKALAGIIGDYGEDLDVGNIVFEAHNMKGK